MSSQYTYYRIYKPYGMLSQFTPEGNKPALGSLLKFPLDCYPVGSLETEAEGLLILTNDRKVSQKFLDSKAEHKQTYFVQVDGAITEEAIEKLSIGVEVKIEGKSFNTQPANVKIIEEPKLPSRNPPVRFRKTVPTTWIRITLIESKNKQVRQMASAVGFPALRIVRFAFEKLDIGEMNSGDVMELSRNDVYNKMFYEIK